MSESVKLTIEFDNEKAAKHFMSWLDGQGEQDYWTWMGYREREEKGNITAVRFNYGPGLTITTETGRCTSWTV